jgi:putative ABC transport system permease protein
MRSVLSRMRSLWDGAWQSSVLGSEMDDEFRHHIELRTADLIRSGMPAGEAARRARLEFGSTERWREEGRERRGLRHLDELRSDARYAVRSLRRSPGFTLAAVLTLALGVGANAAIFSLISATLLRPLPFAGADRVVVLYQTQHAPGIGSRPVRWSYPEFTAVRGAVSTVTELAAYHAADLNLAGSIMPPERIRTEMVSASYLAAVGVEPVRGRGFTAVEDSVPGAYPVALLGHELWQRAFGADEQVMGQGIRLNGVPLTVIGVLPAGFNGLSGGAELWIPQAMAPSIYYAEQLTTPQQFLSVVGRLRRDASIEQANAEMEVVGAAAAGHGAAAAGGTRDGSWSAAVLPIEEARRHPQSERAQLVLAGAALFVLLIALVNLSGLLLARATTRARETAVRGALGAGRFRLLRHGLVEGGLLGLFGGAVGLLLAVWSVRTLVALAPERMGGARPRFADLASFAEPGVDWRVIAFATLLALMAGLLTGLVASLRGTRGDVAGALRAGARGSSIGVGTLRRPTVLSTAAIAQVACALVLLVGAALLLQELHRLRTLDPGFEAGGVVTFRLSPPDSEYGDDAAAPLLERVLEGVAAVPGVVSATVSLCPPYSGCSSTPLYFEGQPADDAAPIVGRHYVAPDHFRTLGIPLLRGRALTADDRAGRPRVAVINEAAAQRFWPGEDPLGRRVWFGSGGGFASPDSLTEIVGIVGDVLYATPGAPIRPDFYTSYLQFTWARTTVIVRAAGDPLALAPALRRAIADVDANLPVHDLRTMQQRAAEALAAERFAATTLAVFAGLGLLLASLGVYGIMAYSVAQRRREIGIRLALGATPRGILRFVVRQGGTLAAAGVAIGAVLSLTLGRALPALMADAATADARVYAIALPLLFLIAVLTCWLAARPATRVNPVETIAAD